MLSSTYQKNDVSDFVKSETFKNQQLKLRHDQMAHGILSTFLDLLKERVFFHDENSDFSIKDIIEKHLTDKDVKEVGSVEEVVQKEEEEEGEEEIVSKE